MTGRPSRVARWTGFSLLNSATRSDARPLLRQGWQIRAAVAWLSRGDGPVAEEDAVGARVRGQHGQPLLDESRGDQVIVVEEHEVVAASPVQPVVARRRDPAVALFADHLDDRGHG